MRIVRGETVKVGIIGCGRMAQVGHLHFLARHPSVRIAGVADTKQQTARTAARKYRAENYFSSAEELIEKARPDAVVICTPPWHHPEATILAAENKIHILCEKPMALTTQDCKKMIAACKKNEVYLQIGFVNRFDPGFVKIKEIIRRGDMGKVYQLSGIYYMLIPDVDSPPLRSIMRAARAIGVKEEDLGGWRVRDSRAGGVLTDFGIHFIDLFRWFADDPVTSAAGFTQRVVQTRTNEDHAACVLRFKSGATAYIEAGLCPLTARDMKIHGLIHGERMSLSFAMDNMWFTKGPPLYYNTYAHVKKYTGVSLVVDKWQNVPVLHGRNFFMCKRQTDHFIQMIRGKLRPYAGIGEKWGATGEDGLEATRIVEEIYKKEKNKPRRHGGTEKSV
ncbi:MAG: Gfo/Idh/MocA family oxidoreductase [bacterium]